MKLHKILISTFTIALMSAPAAYTVTLDWNGFFRADNNFIHNYQHDLGAPGHSRVAAYSGEYIPGEGKKTATYSTLFMKLKPKVLVNDNIILHSEWNLGDPVSGFFGRNVPSNDANNPFSTRKDAMDISIARLWLDTHTDFGTLQVGRAPMHWGMGVIFNSGDKMFDRYQSTSDTIRLLSKFGHLTLMPLYAKNAVGRSLSGSQNPAGAMTTGSDDVTDYGFGLKYENTDEDLEAGLLYYKRNASDTQTSYFFPASATPTYAAGQNGMNLKLFDLYAKKSWRRVDLAAEIPVYNGEVGDLTGAGSRNVYKATAFAAEVALNYDTWKHTLKFGTVPGQGPVTTGARGKDFKAMYFHRAYKLGQILFNYNLGNFGFNNPDSTGTTVSPYDTEISNAKYAMLASERRSEQWSWGLGVVYAQANQTAVMGKDYFNHRKKAWETAVASQNKSMGFEVDFGLRYNWDENISFAADAGMLFPGEFFAFNNHALKGKNDRVSAVSFSAATQF